MIISRSLVVLGFHAFHYMVLVSGKLSVKINADFNYDTNIISEKATKSLCENIVLQSSTSVFPIKVSIDSKLDNPSLGCLGRNVDQNPWYCVFPGSTTYFFEDFCKNDTFKILPDASTLYSGIELNKAPAIQKSSFNISFIQSVTTISVPFKVIFNLTDLSRWWPIMGNYGGSAQQRDCNTGQYIQLFTYKVERAWNTLTISRLNFQCSDGQRVYDTSSDFGANIAVDCSKTFGINGMTAYIGSSGSPIGGKFYCGSDYSTSYFGSNNVEKTKTYYCKPGSLVTGTRVNRGWIIDGVGLTCSPINLTVTLTNINSSIFHNTLTLTRANFQITKHVGNINYLNLKISFLNIPQSTYQIRVNNLIKSTVVYGDIVTYGAVITFDPIPQGEVTISIEFDTGLQYSILTTAKFTAIPVSPSSPITLFVILFSSCFLVIGLGFSAYKIFLRRKQRANQENNSINNNMNLSSFNMVSASTETDRRDLPPPYSP